MMQLLNARTLNQHCHWTSLFSGLADGCRLMGATVGTTSVTGNIDLFEFDLPVSDASHRQATQK